MFRTDFEYECLEAAVELDASDGWTLIQMADHYKRVGRFANAIAILEKAEACGEPRVARSSLADVYAQMGQFEDAIATYESIPDAETDGIVRGAKADVLRRWGYLHEAELEYDRLHCRRIG